MKKTEKKIHDFVKKKLEEAKDELAKIGDGYKHSDRLDTKCCVLGAKIEAYEEMLDFISAEPKIVGTTTVDKALERFLLDQCPEVKKKLKALEIIKRSISSATSLDTLLRELLSNGKINQDEFFLLREVMK